VSDSVLPAPLVPPEVDLTDFPSMLLDVQRLRDSDLAAQETPEACWAAVLLWCASWHQSPPASIPDDERWQAKAAGYMARGKIDKGWSEIREGALRNWVRCSDGRLYHPVVAEKAVAAWKEKLARRARTQAATAARGAKHKERDDARDDTRNVQRDEHRDEARDDHQEKGREEKGRELKEIQGAQQQGNTSRALVEGEFDPPPPDETAGTRYGLAARAMRLKGCAANPGDPRLRTLVDQGASIEEFEAVAAEAAEKSKGPAWALAALVNRRSEAAKTQLAQTPAQDWRESRDAVSAKGQALGLGAWQDFESEAIRKGEIPSFPAYRRRVIEAAEGATA
jgi:hypothetical protein